MLAPLPAGDVQLQKHPPTFSLRGKDWGKEVHRAPTAGVFVSLTAVSSW